MSPRLNKGPSFIVEKARTSHSRMEGGKRIIGFGNKEFKVEEIHPKIADFIISFFHYSKKVFLTSFIHLGIFIDLKFVGVLQFGRFGQIPLKHKWVEAETKECLELNRMWLADAAPKIVNQRPYPMLLNTLKKSTPRSKSFNPSPMEGSGRKG